MLENLEYSMIIPIPYVYRIINTNIPLDKTVHNKPIKTTNEMIKRRWCIVPLIYQFLPKNSSSKKTITNYKQTKKKAHQYHPQIEKTITNTVFFLSVRVY